MLPRSIENRGADNRGQRVASHRWTSRLGLERARTLTELLLETEPEWRLYEDLLAAGIPFDLAPLYPKLVNPEDPVGRVWFVLHDGEIRIRHRGDSGFIFTESGREDRFLGRSKDVADAVVDIYQRQIPAITKGDSGLEPASAGPQSAANQRDHHR